MVEQPVFFLKLNYWEDRYSRGGTSGEGSISREREWKWKIIGRYLPIVESVVDVGCGDLSFWAGHDCKDYVGIDLSETVIKRNKSLRPKWRFIISSSDKFITGLKKECVFCFDLLFHIMNEDSFVKTLNNLCNYSQKYVFIHTWKHNPFSRQNALRRFLRKAAITDLKYLILPSKTDKTYQYYRLLENYYNIFERNNFALLNEHENPNGIGCMYVFRKIKKYYDLNT